MVRDGKGAENKKTKDNTTKLKMNAASSSVRHQYQYTNQHGVISQKTEIFTTNTVRT
jgi:hypothetical protein